MDGLLVADFARVLAGPYATMLLGDLGATVIKVEGPDGNDTRAWLPAERDGVSTCYLGVNRTRRSITLDLTHAEDRAAAHELAARADVFVENFKPGGLRRFGLDYAAVRHRNPRSIYCSISGFGSAGGAALGQDNEAIRAWPGRPAGRATPVHPPAGLHGTPEVDTAVGGRGSRGVP